MNNEKEYLMRIFQQSQEKCRQAKQELAQTKLNGIPEPMPVTMIGPDGISTIDLYVPADKLYKRRVQYLQDKLDSMELQSRKDFNHLEQLVNNTPGEHTLWSVLSKDTHFVVSYNAGEYNFQKEIPHERLYTVWSPGITEAVFSIRPQEFDTIFLPEGMHLGVNNIQGFLRFQPSYTRQSINQLPSSRSQL